MREPPYHLIALLGLILLPGWTVQGAEADYVVAPSGKDANPGTADRPFATLARAQKAVREEVRPGLKRDITVLVRGGDYWLTEPLQFGPEDGGTANHKVTYAAWPGENPRLSGGRRISGWKVDAEGTWVVRLPDFVAGQKPFRELFVQGQRCPRARHPNEGFLRIEKAGADRRTSFTFKVDDLPTFANVPETELVFLHDWSISRIRLQSVDHKHREVTTKDPVGCSAAHYAIDHFEKNPRYYLENSPTFLDAPGEWWLSRSGELRYRPRPGEKPDSTEVIAPVATGLLEVQGESGAGRPVRNLHFRGMTFEHCAWQTPERGYAEGQAGFYEQRDKQPEKPSRTILPAAISFAFAEQCSVTESRLAHLGASGIEFGRGCRSNALVGCLVEDIAGNGVMIGETAIRPREVAQGNRVENNVVQRCGQLYFGSVAVWVGMAQDTRVAHNVIRHHPYTGISVGWKWDPTPTPCRGHIVEDNHIHHILQVLSDGGGIYTLGRQPGTILRRNHIHNVAVNLGRAESNGMFLDEGTTDLVIEKNLIHTIARSPLRFHKAGKNLVRHNWLYVGKGVPPVRYNNTPEANIVLEENQVSEQPATPPAPLEKQLNAGLEPAFQKLLRSPHPIP